MGVLEGIVISANVLIVAKCNVKTGYSLIF